MSKKIDLTNQTFGYWTVLREEVRARKNNGCSWICRCQCGREKSVASTALRSGKSASCGECGLVAQFGEPKYFLTFAHKTAPLSEWAEITGLPRGALLNRYRAGWSVEEILFTRLRPGKFKLKADEAEAPPQDGEEPGR